ncbi:MAG TPA: hypothetical protein VJ573_01425 [Actinomycetota bacterium]|nr:hypothetical protein [Actinomycetota bacterium]
MPNDTAGAVSDRGPRRRAAVGLAASLAAAAVFIGGAIWAAAFVREGGPPSFSASPALEGDGVTTFDDEQDRFTVDLPAGWLASEEAINPWVSSPREILAVATYPLRRGGEAVVDFQLPSRAVEDLGPKDVLIWLNESDGPGDFAERPARFGPCEPCGGDDWTRLCAEPTGDTPRLSLPRIHAWWFGFADQGRGFYVFVGMGEHAFQDPERAQQAWEVLDSLRFLPR